MSFVPDPATWSFNNCLTTVFLSLALICVGCEQGGGDQPPVTNSNTTQNTNPQVVPLVQGREMTPGGAATANAKVKDTYELTVNTDVFGAIITLREPDVEEPLETIELTQDNLTTTFEVPSRKDLIVQVDGYSFMNQSPVLNLTKDESVDVNLELLDGPEFRELVKSATCLVRIPDGGFGSGFLYGDRQTIVTAAHCVAAKDVSELQYTFFPDEDREVTVKDARLFFYDQKQDVAVLRLPEPMGPEHYWLWSTEQADVGDEVLVMGNPGRNGEYDPMYARSCKVSGVRPDELRLDVEIYPGYSGGPVVMEGTNKLLGVVSYKIIRSRNYEELGYSFARSGDIAADAYDQWVGLNDQMKDRHVSRVEDRYSREFGKFLAHNTALAYYGDSAVYTVICMSVMSDYQSYINRKLASLGALTLSQQRIVMRKAHKEYIEDVAPDIAERVKKRVSPKLRATSVEQDHKIIMEDENVSQEVKDSLEKARTAYLELKAAAENIVDTDKNQGKSRSADEFMSYIIDLWGDVNFHADDVLDMTERR